MIPSCVRLLTILRRRRTFPLLVVCFISFRYCFQPGVQEGFMFFHISARKNSRRQSRGQCSYIILTASATPFDEAYVPLILTS